MVIFGIIVQFFWSNRLKIHKNELILPNKEGYFGLKKIKIHTTNHWGLDSFSNGYAYEKIESTPIGRDGHRPGQKGKDRNRSGTDRHKIARDEFY